MQKNVAQNLCKISNIIEFFIGILIMVVIAIESFNLIQFVVIAIVDETLADFFTSFLQKALNLIIGIEFVKMLCNHRPGTIIEVLLFAIARQMIVEHLGVVEIIVGVTSIAILFATRKYLFRKNDE